MSLILGHKYRAKCGKNKDITYSLRIFTACIFIIVCFYTRRFWRFFLFKETLRYREKFGQNLRVSREVLLGWVKKKPASLNEMRVSFFYDIVSITSL